MPAIDTLLKSMLERGGSDLHLSVGLPPKARISGSLTPLLDTPLDQVGMEALLHEICPEWRWKDFLARKDLDFAYELGDYARFRCNFLYNHWGMAAVMRQIPAKIIPFEKLGLPEAVKSLCELEQGLVVVTGPTGNGKSTTLAAMIDYINRTKACTIITIEDPVEFVHQNNRSILIHREVGEHTSSFADALKGAMRHDPDIVLVGEMRELDTMKLALSCASMGMLVFGTLHTNNAAKTVDRIINAFPSEEQNQVRVMLASCLRGVVAQLLCRRAEGGRCAAHEILLHHDALPNTIRSGRISDIKSLIESSGAEGMVTMDTSLMRLLDAGTITASEAYMKASVKAPFANRLPPAP